MDLAALHAAEGLPLVLASGQATLLWARAYGLVHRAATRDVDWHTTSKMAAREYAERLGVARSTLLRWIRDGRIPSLRLSAKAIRLDWSAVVAATRATIIVETPAR